MYEDRTTHELIEQLTGASPEAIHDLLLEYGSIRGLARASEAEPCIAKRIGKAKAHRLFLALELAHRTEMQRLEPGQSIRSAADIFAAFQPRLCDVLKEQFYVILLDGKNRIIRDPRISEGSLTMSLVHPREVYRPAILAAAAGVIFLHNHPSGDPSPSPEDIELTRRLAEVGKALGIRVIDHVVVGETTYVSFAEQGYPL